MVAWVWCDFDNIFGPAEVAGAGNVLQGGQWAASDLLGCVDDSLEGSLVWCRSAAGVPRQNAVHQSSFDGGAVKGHNQFTLKVVFPEHSQEV